MAGVKGRSGGARSGAGRKPKEPVLLDSPELETSDPKRFLTALMNDSNADVKLRADAAKALLAAELRAIESKGKKEKQNDEAKKIAGRFVAASPPKLIVNNR